MKHIFGPVPSRRLGFSLGVDVVVPKTCTLDCVYCELGETTDRTVCRRPYVDVGVVLDELEERLREHPDLDYITVSGSGEPTLNSDLGKLIEGIRRLSDKPIAVLTNGTLLSDPDVRHDLLEADVVAPSLDAVSDEVFRKVNRPHSSLDATAVAAGIAQFSEEFPGALWLETVIVEGMNDDSGEIALLAETIRKIRPDRMQVNTVVRPPAVSCARGVDSRRLRAIAEQLAPGAEVIAPSSKARQSSVPSDASAVAVTMAARRPVTAGDVARTIGISQAAAAKLLNELVERGSLSVVRHGQTLYYRK